MSDAQYEKFTEEAERETGTPRAEWCDKPMCRTTAGIMRVMAIVAAEAEERAKKKIENMGREIERLNKKLRENKIRP